MAYNSQVYVSGMQYGSPKIVYSSLNAGAIEGTNIPPTNPGLQHAGIYKNKTGTQLNFRTLSEGPRIDLLEFDDTVVVTSKLPEVINQGTDPNREGIYNGSTGDKINLRSLLPGQNITLFTVDNEMIEISAQIPITGTTNKRSVETGAVFAETVDTVSYLRVLEGDTSGISLLQNADTIQILNTVTAANQGGANELFIDKTDSTLNLRTLEGLNDATVTTSANKVQIDVQVPIKSVTAGDNIMVAETGSNVEITALVPIKTISPGSNITTSQTGTNVTINADVPIKSIVGGNNVTTSQLGTSVAINADVPIKSITAGTNVTVTQTGTDVTINAGSGPAQTNQWVYSSDINGVHFSPNSADPAYNSAANFEYRGSTGATMGSGFAYNTPSSSFKSGTFNNIPITSGGTDSGSIGTNCSSSGLSAFTTGNNNTASGPRTAIIGGQSSTNNGDSTIITGGISCNIDNSFYSVISGGMSNTINNAGASHISGGSNNTMLGQTSGIFTSANSQISALSTKCVINGGNSHTCNIGDCSAIVGGYHNNISGTENAILAGQFNTNSAARSCIIGGASNSVTHQDSCVLGGQGLTTDNSSQVVVEELKFNGALRSGANNIQTVTGGTTIGITPSTYIVITNASQSTNPTVLNLQASLVGRHLRIVDIGANGTIGIILNALSGTILRNGETIPVTSTILKQARSYEFIYCNNAFASTMWLEVSTYPLFANLGTGAQLYTNTTNVNNVKSLVAGSGVNILESASDVTLSSTVNAWSIRDERVAGTQGGAIPSAAWSKRPINTISYVGDASLINKVTLDAINSQITIQPGKYIIDCATNGHPSTNGSLERLYNVTDATVTITGVAYLQSYNGIIKGQIEVLTPKVYEIQKYPKGGGGSTTLLGVPMTIPNTPEIYATLNIISV